MPETQNKYNRQIYQKLAAGLNIMNKKPDAFIYCEGGHETWDQETILEIPVFHSCLIDNRLADINDCPFIPIWKEDGDYRQDRKDFNYGYINL
jgi:hypothetical protein